MRLAAGDLRQRPRNLLPVAAVVRAGLNKYHLAVSSGEAGAGCYSSLGSQMYRCVARDRAAESLLSLIEARRIESAPAQRS